MKLKILILLVAILFSPFVKATTYFVNFKKFTSEVESVVIVPTGLLFRVLVTKVEKEETSVKVGDKKEFYISQSLLTLNSLDKIGLFNLLDAGRGAGGGHPVVMATIAPMPEGDLLLEGGFEVKKIGTITVTTKRP